MVYSVQYRKYKRGSKKENLHVCLNKELIFNILTNCILPLVGTLYL